MSCSLRFLQLSNKISHLLKNNYSSLTELVMSCDTALFFHKLQRNVLQEFSLGIVPKTGKLVMWIFKILLLMNLYGL